MPPLFNHPADWLASMGAILAQGGAVTPRAARNAAIYWWLGVIVAAALGMLIIALILRKWLYPDGDAGGGDPGADAGFTLADLRDMHRRGELSDEQFQNARRAMLARGRAQLAEDEPEPETADEDDALMQDEDEGEDEDPDDPDDPDKPRDWPRNPDDPEGWRPGNH